MKNMKKSEKSAPKHRYGIAFEIASTSVSVAKYFQFGVLLLLPFCT